MHEALVLTPPASMIPSSLLPPLQRDTPQFGDHFSLFTAFNSLPHVAQKGNAEHATLQTSEKEKKRRLFHLIAWLSLGATGCSRGRGRKHSVGITLSLRDGEMLSQHALEIFTARKQENRNEEYTIRSISYMDGCKQREKQRCTERRGKLRTLVCFLAAVTVSDWCQQSEPDGSHHHRAMSLKREGERKIKSGMWNREALPNRGEWMVSL
ncbi:hypothetical protein F7725_015094 [Dissostichus mawsoni]|uniref:Uncharacterized protein n=1 Tax=Dissostichus mawsoni TaxID=36200 RepID=A0A7J5YJE5_DISMA|nr:hypothetical protein F7725_015094 [Dissostichus mawsoni]